MTKKIFTLVLFVGIAFLSHAQTADENAFAPKKGDFQVSLNLGVGSSVGNGALIVPNQSSYSVQSPSDTWFDKGLALNVEFRWMFASKWALKAKGGLVYSFSPEYSALPGVWDEDQGFGQGDVPDYQLVPESNRLQYNAALGIDRMVRTKYSRLFFHYGLEAGFAYGRTLADARDENYSGKAVNEVYGIYAATVVGFDYYLGEAIYTGLEICPVGYSYSVNNIRPQAGLKLLSADTHSLTFLSCPSIKLGFRF